MTRLAKLFLVLAACGTPAPVTTAAPSSDDAAPAEFPVMFAPAPPELVRLPMRSGSPVVLARYGDATIAFVADGDRSTLHVVDVDAQDDVARLALPGKPAQLVMLADRRIVATLRDRNELVVIDGAPDHLRIAQHVPVASEPIGLALSPDDRTLVATSGFGHVLTQISVGDGLAVARTFATAPEPRGVVVADDGRHVYVAHAVGQAVERFDLEGDGSQKLALGGVEEFQARHSMVELIPRQACQGFALVKSAEPAGRIFLPQVEVNSGEPHVVSEGYGGTAQSMQPEVFDVAVLDEDAGKVVQESLALRIADDTGCVLPRAAAVSKSSLFVTCLGTSSVVELDAAAVAPGAVRLRSWAVGAGPTGIAIDEAHERAVVWSQFAQKLTTISLARDAAVATIDRGIVLDHDALPDQLARGRELFHTTFDSRISTTGQACASCHPDGRQDSLVWSSPNGPRQTPMLAGRLTDSAPYGWNGDARSLPEHVRTTFTRLKAMGKLPQADFDALLAYIAAMPAPTPGESDDPLVAEGETVFQSSEAGCATCHGDDGRSPDGKRHDVGSRIEGDTRGAFDTPSLAFIGGTGPYYHDGRYATLRELLVKTRGAMGQSRKLTDHELDALEAYLRTR